MSKWVKPIRTAIQVLLPLIPVVPVLVPALGLSATAGVGAALVGGATLLSRLMQLPSVEKFLEALGIHSQSPSTPESPDQ